jgi:hypothetical protein
VPPLDRVDDPGDDVERPRPVDATPVRVHRERDAHRQDVQIGVILARLQLVDAEAAQGLDQNRSMWSCAAIGQQQLVVGPCMHTKIGHSHSAKCRTS